MKKDYKTYVNLPITTLPKNFTVASLYTQVRNYIRGCYEIP